MSSHPSPIHRGPDIVNVSTDSPNSAMPSTSYDTGVGVGDEVESKPRNMSKETKRCFLISYGCFVVMFIAFFFVIALTYPLEPVLYVNEIYVPRFDKFTPNISAEMKNVTFVTFRFENRNKLISVSYDDYINVTIYYVPNSTRTKSVRYGNVTLYGFNQNRGKPFTMLVETPTPGMSSLLKIKRNFSTMTFPVYLEFIGKYHCRELGIHMHWFIMTADVEVSLESGRSSERTIEMIEYFLFVFLVKTFALYDR